MPSRQTGAKVGFSLPGKKQVQGQNLLIIHEILTIILCGEKYAPSNKILFSEINTTFAHLVCHLLPGRLVISRTYPVHFRKNQLRAQVLNPDGCRAFLSLCFSLLPALAAAILQRRPASSPEVIPVCRKYSRSKPYLPLQKFPSSYCFGKVFAY